MIPHSEENYIFAKGTEIDIMVKNLIECAHDKEDGAKETMQRSLISIGFKEPKLVLSSSLSFLKKNIKSKKISTGHRIVILTAMEKIIKETDSELIDAKPFVGDIVVHVIEEMTSSKDLVPEWQSAASDVLVALSTRFCVEVMEELSNKLQPSTLPHFFVMQTLGNMATNNTYEMVPYLTGIITQTLTFLGLVKLDNMRWVIAFAMARFCEAIQEYLANPERGKDSSVTTHAFSTYVFSAYEVFFNTWLQTKETKLRVAVIDALSQMVHIIDQSSFEAQLSRLLSGILAQYKRSGDAYYVSRALSHILEVACHYQTSGRSGDAATTTESPGGEDGGVEAPTGAPGGLGSELDPVFNLLFLQISQSPDPDQPLSMKNQNEVRRCFATLCNCFPDRVVAHALGKLDGPDRSKCGALLILRHLVISCEISLDTRKSMVVSGLRCLLSDQLSNRVKLHLAHAVIAMGGQGYLGLEGGKQLVEFVVKQCTIPTTDTSRRNTHDPDFVSNAQLRHMCENILHLGSSTVRGMRPVLWPYLLELVAPVEFTEAAGPVCRALSQLLQDSTGGEEGTGQAEMETSERLDLVVDYDEQVNIPGPQFLVARMLVLAGWPLHGNKRGIHILRAMQALASNFHENLRDIWNIVIPKLINYYTSTQEPDLDSDEDVEFDQMQWEDLMLKMVAKSIEQVCDEEWTVQLGEALGQQIPLYEKYPEERSFLFKCLGTVMANSSKKTFYESHLELVYNSVRHTNTAEREGGAVCFGLCAASHLDAVLARLEAHQKSDARRPSGFLGFIKDRTSSDSKTVDKEGLRATLLLAYGHVIFYAPPELVTSRLETSVMKALLPAVKNVKDPIVRSSVIRCIDLIGQALQTDRLGSAYRFESKVELLASLLSFVKAEPITEINTDTRTLAFQAASPLFRLDPVPTDNELRDLLITCTEAVYPLPPDGVATKKVKETPFSEVERQAALTNDTLKAMNNFFVEILAKLPGDTTLTQMFKTIQKWMESLHDCERQRSLSTLSCLLLAYLGDINKSSHRNKSLTCLGELIGHIIPRVADPQVEIRQLAIECIHLLLQVQSALEGGIDESGDRMVAALPTLKERLKKVDSNIMFTAVSDLAKVLAKKVPSSALHSLLKTLYANLLDPQSHGASAVCVVINAFFKTRGSELSEEVSSILSMLHEKINLMEAGTARTGTLRAVRTLASMHLVPLLNTIMTKPLPLDSVWCEMLVIIGGDGSLLSQSLYHLVELQARTMPYEERDDPRDKKVKLRIATQAWLAALNCLQVLCRAETQGSAVIINEYSRLLSSWIMAISCGIGCHTPIGKSFEQKSGVEAGLTVGVNPVSIPIEGLRNFFQVTESHDVIEELSVANCWTAMETIEGYLTTLTIMAKALTDTQCNHVTALVNNLAPALTAVYEPRRIAVTAFLGSLVEINCSLLTSLLDPLMTYLLGRLGDSSPEVRRLALVGLGNMGNCDAAFVQRHSTNLLSSLACGMDDRQDPEDAIAHAAMAGLARVMTKLEEGHVRQVLVSICLKMLPCYEKPRASVRATAFRLFGTLAMFAKGPSLDCYLAQLDGVMVSLLLHLNDPEEEVVMACKTALKQAVPLLGNDSEFEGSPTGNLSEHVRLCLREETRLHYGEFLNDFAKIAIVEFPTKVNDYVLKSVTFFKSEWPEIQCNAAMLAGFLLGNFPDELRQCVQKEHICMELIHLLRAQDSKVRAKAAEAISLLHMY